MLIRSFEEGLMWRNKITRLRGIDVRKGRLWSRREESAVAAASRPPLHEREPSFFLSFLSFFCFPAARPFDSNGTTGVGVALVPGISVIS